MYKVLIIGVVCAAVQAVEYGGYGRPDENKVDYYAEPNYAYHYSVHDPHTGDIKSQQEERKGDSTRGVYSLVEADGSKRTVEYSVEGKSGFVAHVGRSKGYEQSNGGYYQQQSLYRDSPSYSHSSSYHSGSSSYGAPEYHRPAPLYHRPEPSYHRPSPVYHRPEPLYHRPGPEYHQPSPSYRPSYSGAAATSSVSFSTKGAKITTSTKHIPPVKSHY